MFSFIFFAQTMWASESRARWSIVYSRLTAFLYIQYIFPLYLMHASYLARILCVWITIISKALNSFSHTLQLHQTNRHRASHSYIHFFSIAFVRIVDVGKSIFSFVHHTNSEQNEFVFVFILFCFWERKEKKPTQKIINHDNIYGWNFTANRANIVGWPKLT